VIEKLCEPINFDFLKTAPTTPWPEMLNRLRNSAPPAVRKQLLPFPASWEPSSSDPLANRLLGALLPVDTPAPGLDGRSPFLAEYPGPIQPLPVMATDPWLSHSLRDRLHLEMRGIELITAEEAAFAPVRASEGGGGGEGDPDDGVDPQFAGVQAQAAALQRQLDEMKAAILPNLGKWTERRNEQLAVMAAT
jgi:hypothetical protein